MSINRIVLAGRLTRDPELRYTPNGKATASFTIAVNRKFKRDEADFITIVAWNQLAEHCANYLAKGRQVAVDGRLQIRSYDAQDGQKRWVTEVVADDVQFLDKGAAKKEETGWEDVGREVRPEDVDVVGAHDDDVPF